MNPIKPTVGRVVLYTPSPNALAEKKGQPYPAIITHVWSDECVNLFVCPDGSFGPHDMVHTSVLYSEGEAPGTWRWMPYQMGQAAKTEELQKQLAEKS
jgi:hypothetical protein